MAVIGACALTVLAPAAASAAPRPAAAPVDTVARGLEGPFGLDVVSSRHALVAQSGTGEITSVDLRGGAKRTLISGLSRPAGVASHDGKIYVVLGAGGAEAAANPPPSAYPPGAVLVADATGQKVRVLADLTAYERKYNPDKQRQFDPAGRPYDALSNPFGMVATKWGLLIADGGANDVLRVNPKTGRISTFFVPPNPMTPACRLAGAQSNPGATGCDSVPTGVAAHGRHVYVSTLGAEKPGAAAVYQLDGRTGKVLRVWRGLTSLTGVAVAPNGTVYASEVLFGAPAGEGPLPAGFDPATIGRLTRIQHGKITHASVTMPTGLDVRDGRLYASSWSTASSRGLPKAGKIVRVQPAAFR